MPLPYQFLGHLNAIQKSLVVLFSTLILIAFIYGLYANRSFLSSPNSAWTLGEWMISYAGGFVRRGLIGEIVYRISFFGGQLPFIYFNVLAAIGALLFVWLAVKKLTYLFPLEVVLSPLIILGPFLGNYALRKDLWLMLIFAASLSLIYLGIGRNPLQKYAALTVAIALSFVAALIHEAYLFWAIPAISLLGSLLITNHKIVPVNSAYGIFYICIATPFVLQLLALVLFSGSLNVALAVHSSWNALGIEQSGQPLLGDYPSGAIQALSWSFADSLHQVWRIWSSIEFIPWVLTYILFANILIGSVQDFNSRSIIRFFVVHQTAFCLPLFLIGIDYGRWLFVIIASSAFLSEYAVRLALRSITLNSLISAVGSTPAYSFLSSRILPGFTLYRNRSFVLAFIGAPVCCWSLNTFFASTPIGSLIKAAHILN